jgi:hypothetical protein
MAAKALELEQAAAAQNSSAAKPLQQAADAFNNVAQVMAKGQFPNVAQSAQHDAVQALQNAANALAQDAAGTAQQKKELAGLERNMQQLSKLIEDQGQMNLVTAKALGQPGLPDRAARELARQQGRLRKEADNVRQSVGTAAPDSVKALDEANAEMAQAVDKFDGQSIADGVPPQKAALAALYKAQDSLADKIGKAAQALGEEESTPKTAASVASQLERAQSDVAAAQQSIGASNLPQAARNLGSAAQKTAQAGSDAQAIPQAARDAIRQAQQAVADAAASAGAGHQQDAQSQAAQAGQALSAAQSALDQVQSGIGALASDSPSRQPGQASQSTGQNQPNPRGNGANEKTWTDQAGAAKAGQRAAHGNAQFLGLPERDRAAIEQSQSERYPQEYGAMIEEYMRSVANE